VSRRFALLADTKKTSNLKTSQTNLNHITVHAVPSFGEIRVLEYEGYHLITSDGELYRNVYQ